MKKSITLLFFFLFTLQIGYSQCDIPGGEMENFLDITEEFEYDFDVELDSTLYINPEFVPILRTLFLIFSDLFYELTGVELQEFVSGGLGQNKFSPGAEGTPFALQLVPGRFLNFADGGTENFVCGMNPSSLQGYYRHRGVDNDTAIVIVILDDEPSYDPIFNSESDDFSDILDSDVDAIGFQVITGGPDTYTAFDIPIQYSNPMETPDSAFIYILTFGDSLNLAEGNEMYYVFDEFKFSTTVSTDDLDRSESITISPNPTNDVLRIESNDYPISDYKVFNATGQLILQSTTIANQQQQIDVSDLPAGVYYLEMTLDNYFGRKKFVKM